MLENELIELTDKIKQQAIKRLEMEVIKNKINDLKVKEKLKQQKYIDVPFNKIIDVIQTKL